MNPGNLRQRILITYSLFVVCSALITALAILGISFNPGSPILPGLSPARLLLASILAIIIILFSGLTIKAGKNGDWAKQIWERLLGPGGRGAVTLSITAAGLIVGWIGWFLPAYRTGSFSDYFTNLHPLFIWMTVTSAPALPIILIERYGFHWPELKSSLATQNPIFKAGGLALILFALIWAGVGWSGIGLHTPEDYWYGAGVPVLGVQVCFALVIGAVALWMKKFSIKKFDLIAFLLIWLVSAILWSQTPLKQSFFLPGPYFPNNQFYPNSDSVLFDTGGQFALIGQGFLNGQFFDRALYMGFLFFLHMLAGQNYERLLAIQAAIFAIFPALMYLLGKSVHSRALGFTVATLIMLRGINAISVTTFIDTADPKMMLTDFPTAIGVLVLALLMTKWLEKPSENWQIALWIGAILGLTFMLRTNALVLIPFIMLFGLLGFGLKWKKWLIGAVLIVLAMLTTTLPWDLRNHAAGAPLFDMYYARIQSVLKERYGPIPPEATPTPQGFVPDSFSPVMLSKSTTLFNPSDVGGSGLYTVASSLQQTLSCRSSVCNVISHFLHNLVTSVLILPTSPVLDDLRTTVKDSATYWQPLWDGSLSTPAGIALALNLLLIAIGIGSAWERRKLIGLAPLFMFIAYNASNGLARTSGGRYIVPMDWVAVFYFALGALQIIIWLGILFGRQTTPQSIPVTHEKPQPSRPFKFQAQTGLMILVTIFGIGSILPLSEHIYPPRYPAAVQTQIPAILQETNWVGQVGIKPSELQVFLQNPAAKVLIGRALYPRYYRGGRGEPGLDYPYLALNYDRTVFTLISPSGQNGVILASSFPPYFPHASDVIVIGCDNPTPNGARAQTIDALAVFVLNDYNVAYSRNPAAPLNCPVPEPVCDNNHNCR